VRENGRQKICVRGLLENKVHDAGSLVQVANAIVLYCIVLYASPASYSAFIRTSVSEIVSTDVALTMTSITGDVLVCVCVCVCVCVLVGDVR